MALSRRREAAVAGNLQPSSPIPLYYQIASMLRGRIVSGVYPAGSLLGTEKQLAESFGVSRITIRQALTALGDQGLVDRQRARGTFVAATVEPHAPVELDGYLDEIILHADYAGTVLAERDLVPAGEEVAAQLGVDAGEPVYRYQRLRSDGAGPRAWIVNYVPQDVGERFPPEALHTRSLLQMIDNTPGLRLVSGYETISAIAATAEVAERMAVPVGSPILFVERVASIETGRRVEFVKVYYPGAKHRYGVRLGRLIR